jgi:hypothetical protein
MTTDEIYGKIGYIKDENSKPEDQIRTPSRKQKKMKRWKNVNEGQHNNENRMIQVQKM